MSLSKSFLVIVLFSLFSPLAYPHDSRLATIEVTRIGDSQWIMKLMSPLFGLDASLRAYGADKSNNGRDLEVGSREYKERLVAYIKSEFSMTAMVSANNVSGFVPVRASLGKGRLKLNDHLSTLIFEINGLPVEFTQLVFRLAFMANIKGQQHLLKLIDGSRTEKYVLIEENDFSVVVDEYFQR